MPTRPGSTDYRIGVTGNQTGSIGRDFRVTSQNHYHNVTNFNYHCGGCHHAGCQDAASHPAGSHQAGSPQGNEQLLTTATHRLVLPDSHSIVKWMDRRAIFDSIRLDEFYLASADSVRQQVIDDAGRVARTKITATTELAILDRYDGQVNTSVAAAICRFMNSRRHRFTLASYFFGPNRGDPAEQADRMTATIIHQLFVQLPQLRPYVLRIRPADWNSKTTAKSKLAILFALFSDLDQDRMADGGWTDDIAQVNLVIGHVVSADHQASSLHPVVEAILELFDSWFRREPVHTFRLRLIYGKS